MVGNRVESDQLDDQEGDRIKLAGF